jgi:hypothetical protein
MTPQTSTSYGYQLRTPHGYPPYYTITTDRDAHLQSDSPIFDSIPELYAHLLTLHPSPDPNLSFLLPDEQGDPDSFTSSVYFTVADEPVYCGPESELTLKTLLFRYRRILVRDSPFFQNLQPPFHLNTKITRINNTRFRTLIFSPSVATRTQTRRDNITSAREALLSPSSLPVSLFPPLHSWSLLSPFYSGTYTDNPITLHSTKAEIVHDYRGDTLFSVAQIIFNNFHSLFSLADQHCYFATPWLARPFTRELKSSSPRDLVRTLLPFLPWFPHLANPTLLEDSDPSHSELPRFLRDTVSRYSLVNSAQKSFFSLIPTTQHSGDMTRSSGRGNMVQLIKTVNAPITANDEHNQVQPWLITRSYSKKLKPSE